MFRWSSYILKLEVIHYTGVNILDDTTSDFKVVETLEIELTPNEWVNIPVESLEQDYIISLDTTVEIRHDKPEIHLISGVDITEITPNPIQIGQNTDIYAQLLDTDGQSYDLTDGVGKTVYFYEVLNPILYNLIAEPSIIQTSETTDITVQMKDSDGSKIGAGETVYFYAVEGAEPVPPTPTPVPTTLTLTSDKDILSYYDSDSAVLSATVKDQNGEVMSGQSVVFKKGSEVLATKTTDSVGVASYTYASQGVGDVALTVECMNLQETYSIEDCKYWNDGTSASSFEIPSGASVTTNGDYLTIASTTSEKLIYIPVTLANSDNWEYSVKIVLKQQNKVVGLMFNDNTYYASSNASNGIYYYTIPSETRTNVTATAGDVITIRRQNGVTKFIVNGTELGSKTATHKSSFRCGFYTYGSAQYVDEIKLKPL
ncbi:MAG: Ig-like domain-containing protein [Bacilli bacterium]|nr:Ig-like domain-containing protein [Bacilli bacterium]